MVIYRCNDISDSGIYDAAKLHVKHLSYRSFITKFGVKFLEALYKDWLQNDQGVLILSKDGDSLGGFVLGIKNKDLLFEPVKKRPFKYLRLMLPSFVRKPWLIYKVIQTLLYKTKTQNTIKSELLVIVTDDTNRSKGLGSHLVALLEHSFSCEHISNYIVTVHAEMHRSNNFYSKIGMTYQDSFHMYGTKWNIYQKQIDNDTLG